MVDYTTALMFAQPDVGSDINIWGGEINADLDLIEQAIVGRTAFVLSGTKTLVRTPGVIDEARSRILDVTAGTGGKVIIPSVPGYYIVRNKASGNVLFTVDGTNGASITANTVTFVVTDGANVWSPNLDGYIVQVEALIAAGIVDMNAILADAEAQVALAADQVALAAVQVDAAEAQADAAHTFSISAGNSAAAAAASAVAAAKSAADAALFDPSSYYTKAQTYSKSETDAALLALSGKAPANLNSIEELATSIGNDPAYAATVTASLAQKSNLTDRGLVLLQSGTIASAVAALDITTGLDATYDEYELHLFHMTPSAQAGLSLQISANAGAAWLTGNFFLGFSTAQAGLDGGTYSSFGSGAVGLTPGNVQNAAGSGGVSGVLKLFRPSATKQPSFLFNTICDCATAGNGAGIYTGGAQYKTETAYNAVRIKFFSGNIASGLYKLYGVKK